MFYDPRITRCFLYNQPIDCRKSHNGLVYLVTEVMKHELRSGAIFLFVSRDRKTAKALKWDGSGAIVFHKKMERGRIMNFSALETTAALSAEELTQVLAGAQVRLDLKL